MLLFIFDEASKLFNTTEETSSDRYPCLRRILRLLRHYPIWSFFLSTNSHVQQFNLPNHQDPSARISDTTLTRIPPFFALPLNIEMATRMGDPKRAKAELAKSMSGFSTLDHLSLYGRPLWQIYKRSPQLLRTMAQNKLLNSSNGVYTGHNKLQVLAVIATRVSLDPCLNTSESLYLAEESVNSHCRVITSMEPSLRKFKTMTPSEPVLAEVAANLLMSVPPNGKGNITWVESIHTLTRTLLYPGLVEKGLKGELYARLILIIARDFLLKPGRTHRVPLDFPYAMHFRFLGFLEALFNAQDFSTIADMTIITKSGKGQDRVPVSLKSAFNNAWCNFTHFTSTDKEINFDELGELLHGLVHSQAALQCAFRQSSWDLIVPIYLGDVDQPFNRSYLSAMFVQVKNRQRKSTLWVAPGDYVAFNSVPIFCLLLDLGLDTGSVSPCQVDVPHVYAVHASGATARTFRVLSQNSELARVFGDLLSEISCVRVETLHDRICDLNATFNYHTFASRFPADVSTDQMNTD